ncbi:hypothetical protein [Vulcanisaeta distributa]|uniref:Uncharacterized protein n=1 Tax=Vulcanisaeta distributa (strain DSM 14429 / JCM 11212 / NBRC 100878 / IC-017) TaxID=572478 RepID=E1QPC4_VULDI|nr:hypothetical protein [Vulcanisaeta distributa]ADN51412.1 hypothetical protein Vdis_2040 [Vulcanisaeta distributa DSM 14429]
MLPEISIGRGRFKALPNKYALLFMVWYSRGSSMSLYRLLLTTYLASHVVRYMFENPPIISRSILKDLGELINEGLIELRTLNGRSIIKVTDRGRRLIGELYGLSNEYVLFGDYLIVRLRDLFNELARLVNAYQDMDTAVLLSIALREASLREGGVEGNVLRDLAFDLRRPCENALG